MRMSLKEKLVMHNVLKEGHFKLTSGKHSNWYINKDDIFSDHGLFTTVRDMICVNLSLNWSHANYNIITGPAIAGAVLASSVATNLGMDFVYPEKVTKQIISPKSRMALDVPNGMEFRRGYDKKINNMNVVIVEDIITTGKSVNETIAAIKECGGTPEKVIAIWNRTGWQADDCPTDALINELVESWDKEYCPFCNILPLTDPKTGGVID